MVRVFFYRDYQLYLKIQIFIKTGFLWFLKYVTTPPCQYMSLGHHKVLNRCSQRANRWMLCCQGQIKQDQSFV